MVEVAVPDAAGALIAISYAGNPPVAYAVDKGIAQVEEAHLDEFLAVVTGSAIVPPPEAQPPPEPTAKKSAKPAPE